LLVARLSMVLWRFSRSIGRADELLVPTGVINLRSVKTFSNPSLEVGG
jgi:hypothetical protein